VEARERVGHEGAGLRRRQGHLVLLPLGLHGIVSGDRVPGAETRDEVAVGVRAVAEHLHVRHYWKRKEIRCCVSFVQTRPSTLPFLPALPLLARARLISMYNLLAQQT
jgi:hypothetical protein